MYDDIGTLSFEGGLLSFTGGSTKIEEHAVETVVLTRQRVNVVTYIIICIAALPLFAAFAFAAHTIFNVRVFTVLLMCYSVVPIGLAVGLSTKWIRVALRATSGERREAYFADGGSQGWRGILGGTRKIFTELHEHETVPSN